MLVIAGLLIGLSILALFGIEFAFEGLVVMSDFLVGWVFANFATRSQRWRKPVALILVFGWVAWWLAGLVTVFLFPGVSSWLDPAYNSSRARSLRSCTGCKWPCSWCRRSGW